MGVPGGSLEPRYGTGSIVYATHFGYLLSTHSLLLILKKLQLVFIGATYRFSSRSSRAKRDEDRT